VYANLEGIHERLLGKIVKTQNPKQPRVMNYIIEALMEGSLRERDLRIDGQRQGLSFHIAQNYYGSASIRKYRWVPYL
jgi:hypothetical protein